MIRQFLRGKKLTALLAGALAIGLAIAAERAVAFRGGFGGFHGGVGGSMEVASAVSAAAVLVASVEAVLAASAVVASAVFTTVLLPAARALATEVLPTAAPMPALVEAGGAASTTLAAFPTVPTPFGKTTPIGARTLPSSSRIVSTRLTSSRRTAKTPWGRYKTTG